ncbi:MAG: glycosyltransferase family 9 protein [Candidatus Zixiibacteriota bacterium]
MVFKKIEQAGKKFLVSALGLFLRQESLNRNDVDLAQINRILVIRQDDRIGNLILTTPLLSALRRFFPRAKVWYLASKTFHTLFSNSNLVDRILVAKKKQYIFHPLSLVLFIRRVRKQKFNLTIDAGDENNFSLNNSFLVYLSGARYRIGYQKPKSHLFLNLEVPASSTNKHASEMHLDLLRYLVGDFQSEGLKIEVDPAKKTQASEYLKANGVENGDFLVGMHIGGRGAKRWPVESFQVLADWITNSFGAKVIFFWGPEERRIIEKIKAAGSSQIVSRLFDLPLLSALIERCNLFISPDTGAMHLSAALGTSTLALFLDSDPVKFGPQGTIHRIVQSPNGKISIETVKNAFREMVESRLVTRT